MGRITSSTEDGIGSSWLITSCARTRETVTARINSTNSRVFLKPEKK